MWRRIFFTICLFLCLSLSLEASALPRIRKSVVAGSFYPKNDNELHKQLETFFTKSKMTNQIGAAAIIAPHAGYIYSGQVAADVYAAVQNNEYDLVCVLAPSHHYRFSGASVYNGEFYETPLGQAYIDSSAVKFAMMNSKKISFFPEAHKKEHSLEVQVPFLQYAFGSSLRLLPIVIGDNSIQTAEDIARVLFALSKERKLLVVASTDLSHYNPYEKAKVLDKDTVDNILSGDFKKAQAYFTLKSNAACGKCPVLTVMKYAEFKGLDEFELISYANSGDTAGSKDSVVGYAGILLHNNKEVEMPEIKMLSAESRKELIDIVRSSITYYLKESKIQTVKSENDEIQSLNGAFVTLHTKDGHLRGCIGSFISNRPLYETVNEMAVAAAFNDPRFSPLSSLEELADIEIEISVLSPMEKITDVSEIQLGKHGVYIKKGMRSGTFLPQVAEETGWDVDEFLGHCARDKAGIGWDGWKDADIYIYTAEVFNE